MEELRLREVEFARVAKHLLGIEVCGRVPTCDHWKRYEESIDVFGTMLIEKQWLAELLVNWLVSVMNGANERVIVIRAKEVKHWKVLVRANVPTLPKNRRPASRAPEHVAVHDVRLTEKFAHQLWTMRFDCNAQTFTAPIFYS